MHNRSQISNSNSHDNTFNFGNELDISKSKKNKNSELGNKDVFDFQDFQNIGDDKTVKSSFYRTRKQLNSNVIKKDFDQQSNFHITKSIQDNQQDDGFYTKPIVSASMRKIYYQNQNYPKFGQPKNINNQTQQRNGQLAYSETGIINNNNFKQNSETKSNFKQSDFAYTKSNFNIDLSLYNKDYQNNKNKNELGVDSRVETRIIREFHKKITQNQLQQDALNRQSQYKQLVSIINYYKNESQKMSYERMTLQQDSIKQLIQLSNNQSLEEQIRNHIEHINSLNREIEKQRAIERKLTQVVSDLEDEYNQIVESVHEMDFRRPVVIKDQIKVLIDEINQLKDQFQNVERENGSLHLSCTLDPNSLDFRLDPQSQSHGYSKQNIQTTQKLQSLRTSRLEEFNNLFEQIHQQNSRSQDSQFLKNLKLACIKDEWTIFSNKQIQVSLDYRSQFYVKVKIGNKTNQLLKKFCIQKEINNQTIKIMSGEVLNKKSFIVENIKINTKNVPEVFFKMRLTYQIESQDQQQDIHEIGLFCPTGILNCGQFIPLTYKQFQMQQRKDQPILSSSFRTIDKNIINSIDEVLMYFPNLKIHDGGLRIVYGKFVSTNNEETMVIIEDHLDLIKIKVKKSNPPLLKLLQFILCL